ncbi:ABC transporter ATP-binding protein [Rhizobium sp.]
MLEVSDLKSGYGPVEVLRGVDFVVGSGESIGLIGYNGMGKTTLLKTLMGLLPTTSGKTSFDGQSIEKRPAHIRSRLGIGYTPQGNSGFPALTVAENLRLAGLAPSARPKRTLDEVLGFFPRLKPLLSRPSGALSGGERQLMALARAMVHAPRLILLDELTEGIQPSITDEIAECLTDLRKRTDISMLIADQDLSFVASTTDRALLLQKGKVVATRENGELMHDDVLEAA